MHISLCVYVLCVCVSQFDNSSKMLHSASVFCARRAPDFVPMQCMGMTSVPQSQSWQDCHLHSVLVDTPLAGLIIFQPGGTSYDFLWH